MHMPCWMIVVVTAVCGSKLPLILQGFAYFSFWIANGDDFSCQYFQLQECSLLCRSSEYRTLPQYPTVLKKSTHFSTETEQLSATCIGYAF